MKEEQQALIAAPEPVAPNFARTLLYHLSKLTFAHKSSNESCFFNPETKTTTSLFSFTRLDGETCSYAIHAYKGLLTVDNALRKIAQYTSKATLENNLALSAPNFKQTLFYHLAKLSLIESSLRNSFPAKLSPSVKIIDHDQASVHELRQQLIESWQKNGVPMPVLSKTLFEQLLLEAAIADKVPVYIPQGLCCITQGKGHLTDVVI